MKTVSFTRMEDGSKEDYGILEEYELSFAENTADRVIDHLRNLETGLSGYKVTRLEHALQTATRAYRDNADDEMIVAALLHDIGDHLAPYNHGELAASILKPYVSERTYWVLKHHGIFQGYYYFHHLGLDRNMRSKYESHPHYQACIDFCAKWDQSSFDPEYESLPLDFFVPLVRKIFAREPFAAHMEDSTTRA